MQQLQQTDIILPVSKDGKPQIRLKLMHELDSIRDRDSTLLNAESVQEMSHKQADTLSQSQAIKSFYGKELSVINEKVNKTTKQSPKRWGEWTIPYKRSCERWCPLRVA